ncbi:MAG: sensor histidine kinase [Verrucomicrobia bacterium]|nr:sensor histidine kinase [Verrucomicrobiota bacterium]
MASFLAMGLVESLSAQEIAAGSGQGLLTTCEAIRELKPAQADSGLEVRLEGIITVVPTTAPSGLIMQDETAGIWIDLTTARKNGVLGTGSLTPFKQLAVGDRVRMEGVTERGGFAPVLLPRSVEVLAKGCPLPDAPGVTVPALVSGKHDVQRVKFTGVIQESSVGGQSTAQHHILRIANSGGSFLVRVPRKALPSEEALLDTQVSVAGTMISMHNSRAEMAGGIIVTDRVSDVQVLHQSLPPEKAPSLSLTSLRPFEAGGFSSFRRRIVGTVTFWQPGQRLMLQEGNAAVEVTTSSVQPIAIGSVVEAAGFVSRPNPICRLENAVLRVLRAGECPAAVPLSFPELLDASRRKHVREWQRAVFDYHYRLVRLTGTLVDVSGDSSQTGQTLLLRSGGLLLPVRWDAAPATFGNDWRPGSELAVTGIALMVPPSGSKEPYEPSGNGDVSLLMRDADDVQVLTAASWWTRQRLMNVAWAGAALILGILGLTWELSRRVRRQAAELAGRIALQNEAEISFHATLAERNRLGADMHDGLQQFLAGLSMQLEAAHGSLEMGRDAAPALQAARKLLLTLREDFRNCLNALRDTQAEMHIPDILERTSAIIRACHPVEVRVEVQGTPVMLPGNAVANLMLIVQEAASNAVRHGKAQNIVLHCQFTEAAVMVEVADDGSGFDPETIPTDANQYGMPNMHERIDRLHGTLTITSQPGQGTRITARMPLPICGIA